MINNGYKFKIIYIQGAHTASFEFSTKSKVKFGTLYFEKMCLVFKPMIKKKNNKSKNPCLKNKLSVHFIPEQIQDGY